MSPWIRNPKTLSLVRDMEQELHAKLVVRASNPEEGQSTKAYVWREAPAGMIPDLAAAYARENAISTYAYREDLFSILRRADATTPKEIRSEFEQVRETFESLGWTVEARWGYTDEDEDEKGANNYYLTIQLRP